ncbi:MAG TPA: UDP-glucose/GDP-mannose dehydrogenase family protein [Candidatus Hydrogenedentes bacterium]|nr:UDP-glucose/GDP-mannose dehydrogenase family protein [Candidatus Hydrogenedentota bacterium]
MKITIVGTGYQGLVVGTCFAENGHQITCVDRDQERIKSLSECRMPIHEPGLEELVTRNLEEERLRFTTNLAEAVTDCLMVFLCVGTPARDDGSLDLNDLLDAVAQIAKAISEYHIIANKSTCPPGTTEAIEQVLRENTDQTCDVVANPDFLKEGSAIDDFMRPDRIVVGCTEVRVREIMKELYSPFLRTGRPFLTMSPRSAEMMKYALNVMLAARISLMNQLADICGAYDADINEVREALGTDSRIGPTFLFPGLGFGGPGLPRDVATCVRLAKDKGLTCDLIEAIYKVNQRRREQFLKMILEYFGDSIAGKRIALWGASFKPRTDDLRGAPALYIIDNLCAAGAKVVVFDPTASAKLLERYSGAIEIAPKYYTALEGADGLVIATEWNEFRRPDYERMGSLMKEKVIFDGRNLYTPKVMESHGFKYFTIGRPAV